MDNNKPLDIDIGKRDLDLEKICKQLSAKKQLLRSKEDELVKKGKDNEYLQRVCEEYNSYSKESQKEKEQLIVAMNKIIQHLDELLKDGKLPKEEIREEKNVIVKKINRLTKEL
jgi:hypothetical protein